MFDKLLMEYGETRNTNSSKKKVLQKVSRVLATHNSWLIQ